MLVTQQPVLKRFWYPVMPISLLQEGPQSFTLLGQPLVLWLDEEGKPAAVEDRCCHRSAQLSKGIVCDGHIRCPYHGWEFNGSGACVKVPQLTEDFIPRTYKVSGFQCQERYGYAWVALADPLLPIPEIPEAADPSYRYIHEFYEPWACSGLRFMENSFDSAHPHFVHGLGVTHGDQSNPVPPPLDEVSELEDGMLVRHWMEVINPELQKKNLNMEEEKTIRTNVRRWFMPFARTLKIHYPNGLHHLIFSAATPIDDGHSQLVQFVYRNDTEEQAKAADIIAYDRQVTEEDRVILETTDYDTPLDIQAEQHMASDKPGIVMRRKLAALLKAHGEIEQRRPAL
jgi:phenylpropionate dioxygenase-like ring-hydroxylating dioxygenase large terminal subunit